jgi:hypothetical protein
MKKSALFAAIMAGAGLVYALLRSCKTLSDLDVAVARFPLSSELSSLHNDVIQYSSDIHASFDETSPLSTYVLANIHYTAIWCHRGVRTLCEDGWTPLTAILNRTLMDHLVSCIAITAYPERANYMGFKYLAQLPMKLAMDPVMTAPERKDAREKLESFVGRLPAEDQSEAKAFIKKNKTTAYWFSPEFRRPSDVLKKALVPLVSLYSTFSGPAHGSFSLQVFFNDHSSLHDINPREHPQWSRRAIEASSRFLLEIGHVRCVWDDLGHEEEYEKLRQRIIALK